MATEVEFHTGVAEPVVFACRLLRKAYRQGARLLCTAPQPLFSELDRALWTFDERDFVPHVRWPPTPETAARTPIWLAQSPGMALPGAAGRVLVNLGAEAADDAAAFDRIIEIVGTEVDAAASGRQRWKSYRAAGLAVVHHAPARGGSSEAA